MIEKITGRVITVGHNFIIVQQGFLTFKFFCASALANCVGQDVDLWIRMVWNQEKGPAFFAFAQAFQRDVFDALIGCPKVGPTTAINVLAAVPTESLVTMLAAGDEKSLAKVPGIGPKTAKNLILALQEKMQKIETSAGAAESQSAVFLDVQQALMSLGYDAVIARKAIVFCQTKISGEAAFPDILKIALSYISTGHYESQ